MKKRLNKQCLILVFCLSTICLSGGCKKSDNAPKSTNTPVKVETKIGAGPPNSAVQKTVSSSTAGVRATASYNLKGKKDPFKPLITPPEAVVKPPSPAKIKLVDALPIQSHEVSKFVVTGIITGLKENKALLIDPAGKGYVVKTGMLIGNNGGRITKITNTSLEVVERYTDDRRRAKTRKIVLPLAKKSKEISR